MRIVKIRYEVRICDIQSKTTKNRKLFVMVFLQSLLESISQASGNSYFYVQSLFYYHIELNFPILFVQQFQLQLGHLEFLSVIIFSFPLNANNP